MMQYEEALKYIFKNASPLPAEKVTVEDSVGRISKENIYSMLEMPPFDKAAMDGYAVYAQDVKNAPVNLRCIGLIQAGDIFKKKLNRAECVKIMTGAPMPAGAESVIMVEDTLQCGDSVLASKTVKKGENVCFKGEDLKQNQRILARGTMISPAHIAVLAAVGRRFVETVAKPEVAILNTGGEIIQPGVSLGKNKIYNSNGPMLQALLKSDGIKPCFLGIARDETRELKKAVKEGLKKDVLLISGGVSMGDYDLVPEVLASLGVKKIFHKVNIKPGKPLFFGIKNKTLVFGIPGNPVSNFLSYLIFVRPALYKMMGYLYCKPEFKEGLVEKKFNTKTGRKHFVLVKIAKEENQYRLAPVVSHGSADIIALSKADGFMVVDKGCSTVKKNSKIKFITWKMI